jgi:hypothetical protein
MPLENFYEESDKARDRWQLKVAAGFFAVVVYLIFGLVLFSNYREEKEVRDTETERIKRVEALCAELPKPENFVFVTRDPPITYKDATAIIFRYQSDRELEEIMPAFTLWFNSHNWKAAANSTSSFTNGYQTITITKFDTEVGEYDPEFANYEIYCYQKEEKIEFGV